MAGMRRSVRGMRILKKGIGRAGDIGVEQGVKIKGSYVPTARGTGIIPFRTCQLSGRDEARTTDHLMGNNMQC
jgi:hypothetical protein